MSNKVTWKDVLVDFKKRHPSLAKLVCDFRPHSYATITIWLKDGRTLTYNHDTKKGCWGENWKKEG